MAFDMLFSKFKIGNVELKNRIIWTGHGTGFGRTINERHIEYYCRRVKGGVGLIVVGYNSPHPTCKIIPTDLYSWDDSIIPDFKRLTDAVHKCGGKIVTQIAHTGRQGTSDYSGLHTIGASAISDPVNQETPKEMEKEDIVELAQAYGSAARRMKEAGFDGVEIHSGYGGYLIAQFLSRYSNHRTDEYGGSLENRTRFALDVIREVRKAVGDDYLVGMQLSGDEYSPNGLTIDESKKIAKILADTNKLNYMTIKAGTYLVVNMIIPDFQHPVGLWVPLASAIRSEVKNIPIMAVGRINDPVYAEKVLQEGHADLIGVCRALISDPDWPNKAKEGRVEDIRQCIGCNQGCEQYLFKSLGRGLACTQNADAGEEYKGFDEEKITVSGQKKKVLVVGGGPAGMKAAEICSRRGHEVILYEREGELGGTVRYLAKNPFRDEFAGVIRYLDKQIRKSNVNVKTGIEVTEKTIEDENPDVVIFATGAESTRIGYRQYNGSDGSIPGVNQKNVVTEVELFKNLGDKDIMSKAKGNVVVVDGGTNHWRSIGTAIYLSDVSKSVKYVTPNLFPGHRVPGLSITPLMMNIYNRENLELINTHLMSHLDGNIVSLTHALNQKERKLENIDLVVLCLDMKANESLYFKVKDKLVSRKKAVHRIGDCLAPRDTLKAVHDAYKLARTL